MDETLKRTPLYETHRALGARMVAFAGWEMPVQYVGILEEARAVRTSVGLFDISHMGRTYVHGGGALSLLQMVTTNDVSAIRPGQAQYSLFTNPNGGVIDDIIVYREAEEAFTVVVNASNAARDLEWMRAHAPAGVVVDDRTDCTAMIAIQGQAAPGLVARLADREVLSLSRFAFTHGRLAGSEAALLRTGYTGDDGFEAIVPAESATAVWDALQEGGGVPCGLGARDALRIEAGLPLYGHEIDDATTPVEAGLLWAVKPEKGDFIGRDRILAVVDAGPGKRLVGLAAAERIVPRQGYILYAADRPVGTVTSGVFSPTVGHSVAMAYVDEPYHRKGTQLTVEIRGRRHPVTVVPKKNLLGC